MSGSAAIDLATPVPKVFRESTHRLVSPAETVTRLEPLLPMMGITRLANVTGLDRLGVPVVVSIRPNSRSLSCSQGKGLDLAASRASALMETVEGWHAERISHPLKIGSFEDLRYTHRLCDVDGLPSITSSVFTPHHQLLWIEGYDLLGGETRWVPYELVHTNYTLPHPTGHGCFSPTSNGLASGNHLLEAISHALCEVIERDATALWQLANSVGLMGPDDGRVDLRTVDDPACRDVLDRFAAAGVGVSAWEITSDIGVPTFISLITESDDPLHPLHSAQGYGCHPVREVALLRALTEAAQSRLTVITGSRDDIMRLDYERSTMPDILERDRSFHGTASAPGKHFLDGPTFDGDTFNDDVRWALDRLAAAGIEQAIVVDLTRAELKIPVVRVVVPGLDGVPQMDEFVPGPRGRAVLALAGEGMREP